MQISVHSNIGKRRSSNQDYADYYTSSQGQNLFILCDGVGGNQAGDVASEMTTKFLGERFEKMEENLTIDTVESWLNQAIIDVNDAVYSYSTTDPGYYGMSTTLVMAINVDKYIYIAHVGDSRAYAFKEATLTQLTEDHSLVNELIRSGEITPQQGENHPQRNVVTQSIGGTPTVNSEIKRVSLTEVDILMLCSDGLTNMVGQKELIHYFQSFTSAEQFGELLIEAANKAGGTDNITVILVSQLGHSIEIGGDD